MGPARTRIVDGEIVRVDDASPSQASQRQPAHTNVAPIPSHGQRPQRHQQGAGAFDFSASPVALAPEPPEQSLFGLPGLSIFGTHYRSKHLAVLLAATLFLGLKGFLIGNAVWVAYKLYQSQGDGHPPAAAGGQQGGSFQLPAFLQQGGSGQAAPPAGRPAAQSGSSRAQPGTRPNFGQLRGEGQQDGMGMVWGQRASSAVGGHVTAAAHRDNWIGKGPGHKLGSSDS